MFRIRGMDNRHIKKIYKKEGILTPPFYFLITYTTIPYYTLFLPYLRDLHRRLNHAPILLDRREVTVVNASPGGLG